MATSVLEITLHTFEISLSIRPQIFFWSTEYQHIQKNPYRPIGIILSVRKSL